MAYGKVAYFEELRSVAFGAITANFAALGDPISDVCRIFSVFNTTDEDVLLSTDGTTNQIRLSARSGQVFDVTTNRVGDEGLFFKKGTQFYIKHTGAAPSSGNVWIQVVCASGGV